MAADQVESGLPGFREPKRPPRQAQESPPEPPESAPPAESRSAGLRAKVEDLRERGRQRRRLIGSPEGNAVAGSAREKTTGRTSPVSSDEHRLTVDGIAVAVHAVSSGAHLFATKVLKVETKDIVFTAAESYELAAPIASYLEDRIEHSEAAVLIVEHAAELGALGRLGSIIMRILFGLPGGASERRKHREAVEERLVDADARKRAEATGTDKVPAQTYGDLVGG